MEEREGGLMEGEGVERGRGVRNKFKRAMPQKKKRMPRAGNRTIGNQQDEIMPPAPLPRPPPTHPRLLPFWFDLRFGGRVPHPRVIPHQVFGLVRETEQRVHAGGGRRRVRAPPVAVLAVAVVPGVLVCVGMMMLAVPAAAVPAVLVVRHCLNRVGLAGVPL